MEYINQKYNAYGTIDCDINHPDYGWIPTTLSPDDDITAELFAIVAAGTVAPFVPAVLSVDEQIEQIRQAVIAYISNLVKSQGYDAEDGYSKYTGYPNSLREKSEHLGAYESDVWLYAGSQKELFLSGAREIPTPEDFLLELLSFTPLTAT